MAFHSENQENLSEDDNLMYNCEDPNCYFDLARLRGVKYITWENINKLSTVDDGSYTGGAPAKFVNYKFDVDEFVKLVEKAAKHVKNHPDFENIFREDIINNETVDYEENKFLKLDLKGKGSKDRLGILNEVEKNTPPGEARTEKPGDDADSIINDSELISQETSDAHDEL